METRKLHSFQLNRLREGVLLEPNSVDAHLRLGCALIRVGLYSQAEDALLRAVELDPRCVQGWAKLSSIRMMRWDFEACIEACRRILRYCPDSVESLYNLGVAQYYLGKTREMVRSFERLVDLCEEHAAGHYFLAIGLRARGDLTGAKAHLERAEALGYEPEPSFKRELGAPQVRTKSPRARTLVG